MTSGNGTIYVPKDIIFENLLKQEFNNSKFDKIIYYDSCVIVKYGKRYGKIIICDDSIYSYVDALNKFTMETHYKDIYSVEMINDVPDFIFGFMKNKNIHIRIKFKKSVPIKKGKSKSSKSNDPSSGPEMGNNNNNSSDYSTKINDTLTSSHNIVIVENVNIVEDSIDFYILNLHSMAFHLLNKARVHYMIRETLKSVEPEISSSLYLSQILLNRLFDNLLTDLTLSKNSLPVLKDYLLELLEAGLKYTRIKILFWTKANLFQFLVTQFSDNLNFLLSIRNNNNLETTKESQTKTIYSYMNCLYILLRIFNTFFFETDHLSAKSTQLRIDNGQWGFKLIKNVVSMVSYLYDCDQNDEVDSCLSELEIELDCLKHSVTIGCTQLLYHLVCSSEVCISYEDEDPFTLRTVVHLLESMITFDSFDGPFNKFINQILRMQFVWIFPKVFKMDDQILTAERIVSIYQFFSTLRIIVQCVPKISRLFRREMKEEFEHFILSELSFPVECPLSSLALKLLKSFQKNMLNTKDIFID